MHEKSKKIEFCNVEKCKIPTNKNHIVKQKGTNIPQALRAKTDDYIKLLEKREIIKRSESEWRSPIRAIEKLNGEIRLVCNFMSLNNLVEKDAYGMREIIEVVRPHKEATFSQ